MVTPTNRFSRAEDLAQRFPSEETKLAPLRASGCPQIIYDYIVTLPPEKAFLVLANYLNFLSQPLFKQGLCTTCGQPRSSCQQSRPRPTKNHFEVTLLDQPELFSQRETRRRRRHVATAQDLVNKFLQWKISGTDGEGHPFGPPGNSFSDFCRAGCSGLYARLLNSIWDNSQKSPAMTELMITVLVLRDKEARRDMAYPEPEMKANSLLALQNIADDFLIFQDRALNACLKNSPVELCYSDTLIFGKIFELSTGPDTTTEDEVCLMQVFSNFLYDLAKRDGYVS